MIVGFDFDKVLINYPPLISYRLMDFLYKEKPTNKSSKNQKLLKYRKPGVFERKLRIFSHFAIFRKPVLKNVKVLEKISKNKKNKIYLISSRFGFLKRRTDVLLKEYKLKKYFNGIYFNYDDKQPHIFKEQVVKKLKIDIYIDDDLDLVLYLAKKLPQLKLVWLADKKIEKLNLPKNVQQTSSLETLNNLF